MTGVSSHNSKLIPICILQIEKITEAVLSYVFKMAFPASNIVFAGPILDEDVAPGGRMTIPTGYKGRFFY